MIDLPGLGIQDAVVVPGKGGKCSAFLRVIPESKIYDMSRKKYTSKNYNILVTRNAGIM